MSDFVYLIPLLPLVGAAINGFTACCMPRHLVGPIACAGPVAAFGLALAVFLEVLSSGAAASTSLGDWFRMEGLEITFGFQLDYLSGVMALVVTGVGSLIHIYSIGYMGKDPGYARYFAYLNLFMASMLVLVLADNLVLLFLGWEGVGLCSYLLIGFWYEDLENAKAGKKAFVVNRVGDFGFALGMFLIYVSYGTLSLSEINAAVPGTDVPRALLMAMPLLLFVGATGKSAQIPLYIWLPDAMAGPTPVSALIHAATMVTSGVYMVTRLAPLFSASPEVMTIIAVVGAVTALIAGFIALSQNDIKKVLAYSTVSQLGYMFLAAGLGAYGVAIFHLVTHAFFKGLLFLGAGAVIYSCHHEQDMRKMGGLWKKLPVTFVLMLVGALALSGCPLLAGFYSKDAILEQAHHHSTSLWLVASLTAAMTSFYIFRLIAMTFLGEAHHETEDAPEAGHGGPVTESPPVMLAPMGILALLSIGGGIWLHALPGKLPGSEGFEDHGVWGGFVSVAGLVGILLFSTGLLLAWFVYKKAPEFRGLICEDDAFGRVLWRLSSGKMFVDELYDLLVVRPLGSLANALFLVVDRLLIDGLLVGGTGLFARLGGTALRQVQSGHVPTYAGWLVCGAVILVGAILWMLQ